MAWELKKVEDQRQQLIEAYFEGSITMKILCSRFGVSRKTAYKWLKRYSMWGLEGLKDQSKAPHSPHHLFCNEEIELALSLKLKHRNWGPKKIIPKLHRSYPHKKFPSATRMYEIFKEHHLVTTRRLRRRIPATHPMAEVNSSNDTWSIDFKGWFLTQNKEKCEPLTLTDSFSRYLIKCAHISHKSMENVWAILQEAFIEYGLPNRLRSDNGPPFASIGAGRLSQLSLRLVKAGVLPEWIHPGHPEENGRHERLHLTLKEEVADPPASTLQEQIWRMQRFQREYNFERPHEALQMETPASVYSISLRKWDGKLRDPEYGKESQLVRKVAPNGCIRINREYFIGQVLAGEYIGFREVEEGFAVYYGPIYLGLFRMEEGLEKPKIKTRKQKSVTDVGEQCYPCL